MEKYKILFEDEKGKLHLIITESGNLEDATIDGTNIAEEKGWEMLSINRSTIKSHYAK